MPEIVTIHESIEHAARANGVGVTTRYADDTPMAGLDLVFRGPGVRFSLPHRWCEKTDLAEICAKIFEGTRLCHKYGFRDDLGQPYWFYKH